MVSIICPVWNQKVLTHKFLFHHQRLYQTRPDIEIIIVDNGSTDSTTTTLNMWRHQFGDRLKIVSLSVNTGFGPGHNTGAAVAEGGILIFISNDVIPFGDYVTVIEKAAKPNRLLGAELITRDTGWNTFEGKTISYLAGHLVACDRQTWDKLGGWDERYIPCDYEDIDLSMTAHQIGIELIGLNLPVQHLFGQSAKQLDGGRLAITVQSQAKFKEKWGFE